MGRRLFLAGATGAIGAQLVPLLVAEGYEVAGMTRSSTKAARLEAAGAVPVVCDVFERERLVEAVREFAPEIVLHELTDLPDRLDELPDHMARNNRIRREGTRNLLDAAQAAGAARLLAQSVAWELPGEGGEATRALEQMVLDADGVVLRYGQFYGPGTFHPDGKPDREPIVHVAEAASRTVELIDAPSGVYVIAD